MEPVPLIEADAEMTPVLERRYPRLRRAMSWARLAAVLLLRTSVGVAGFAAVAWLFIHWGQHWATHEVLPAVRSAAAVPTRG